MSAKIPGESGAPLVSVIVPVYNAEPFLRRCIDSVLGQSMPDLELIAVNDGSTDTSLAILREYEARDPRVRVFDQENAGQGAARNRALELARGEYVLFVDADDFIERVTLQVTTERAEEDRSDLVHFDWKFASSDPSRPDQFDYYNIEPFWHHRELRGAQCELLFQMHSYFSVINLYRRSFLELHGIRYEVGQIYEDNPFLAKVFSRAESVSMVHSPLYVIQANPDSSTKTGAETDRHMRDHLAAVRKSFDVLQPRRAETVGELVEYHLEKFSIYYMRRVPKHLRDEYARNFVAIVSGQNPQFLTLGRATSWLTRLCIASNVFTAERPRILQRAVEARTRLAPPAKRLLKVARTVKRRVSNPRQTLVTMRDGRTPAIRPRSIVFLGFDERYTGNSRALFEEILADDRFSGHSVQFTTNDVSVTDSHRIAPGSPEFYSAVRSAEIVIAETWIPASVPKHPESTWIQLWHGTPIKRMLFDSHEREITKLRPQHKVSKYRDILRWDYLLVENEYAASKFETAFLFPRERMIMAQYPRVVRLLSEIQVPGIRDELRDLARIGHDECVVLYAPTWRDSNYGRKATESNFDYVLDVSHLAEELGDEWQVLFHDHGYLSTKIANTNSRCIDASATDIQELLLISDVVVSDYSSVILDAMAVEVPCIVYAPDVDQFEESRGLYGDVWRHLSNRATDSVKKVAEGIVCSTATSSSVSRGRRSDLTYGPRANLLDAIHGRWLTGKLLT